MVIKLRARLADGREIVGPIMGNGGMLGSGTLCAGRERASQAALKDLALCRRLVEDGRPLHIFEPSSGHVASYPDFSATENGERVEVPIEGTSFSIEEKPG
jgi:hypothetical protein